MKKIPKRMVLLAGIALSATLAVSAAAQAQAQAPTRDLLKMQDNPARLW